MCTVWPYAKGLYSVGGCNVRQEPIVLLKKIYKKKKKSNIFRLFGQKLHRASFVGRTRCVLLVPLAKGPMTAVPDSACASVVSPNETEIFVVRAMQ